MDKVYEINKENIDELMNLFIERDFKYIEFKAHIEFCVEYPYFQIFDIDEKGEAHIQYIFDELKKDLPVKGTLEQLIYKFYYIYIRFGLEPVIEKWKEEKILEFEENYLRRLYNYFYKELYPELAEAGYDEDTISEIIREKAEEYSHFYFWQNFEWELEISDDDIINILSEAVEKEILK